MAEPGTPSPSPVRGRIIRFDPASGRALSVWPGGGDPEGIAFAGGYLWTADGAGDHSEPQVDQNEAVQTDGRTGKVVRRYAIVNPSAIAATGSRAWVLSAMASSGPASVIALQGGRERRVARLPGELPSFVRAPGESVALCGRSLYVLTAAANGRSLQVTRLDVTRERVAETWTIGASGGATVTCAPGGVAVTIGSGSGGGVWAIRESSRRPVGPFGSRYAYGAVFLEGAIWVVSGQTTVSGRGTVAGYSWPTGRLIVQRTLPAALPGPPVATSASTFWVWNENSRLITVHVAHVASHARR